MPCCTLYPLPYRADPGAYFKAIHLAPGAVLLDSGRPIATRGRFDLFSAWPLETLAPKVGETGSAYLARVRRSLKSLAPADTPHGCASPFTGGVLGYLGYEFGRRLERITTHATDDLGFCDASFGLYDWAFVTDHQTQHSYVVFHPSVAPQRQHWIIQQLEPYQATPPFKLKSPFQADINIDTYQAAIRSVQQYIAAGDCYQVNYTQRFSAAFEGDAWSAYTLLRDACPTPFAGFLRHDKQALLSLSPERFIKVSNNDVETRPIKGTRPRGKDVASDQKLANELKQSAKDRAENLMIVDLLRNDLGRICKIGSVRVPELFSLESYPNVHHLVSSVTGTLADQTDALDVLAASFPGGSITGAPKIRAMEIIDELEPTRRGPYCGSLVYIDTRGNMDSSIMIRTLLAQDKKLYCWGGGGIVADSNWQAEYQESLDKVSVLLGTLEHTLPK